MKLNLQFFADEEISIGVEESETADPMEVEETADSSDVEESETETPDTETEEPEAEQTIDTNAIAAAARRKAEQAAREERARIDAEYARRFGNYKNPITGEPIRSQQDYLDALDAQERLKAEKQLRDNGIDPNLINDLVSKNPAVVQANEYLKQQEEKEAFEKITNDVLAISEYDPSITSLDNVPPEIVQYAIDNHHTLLDAYKILNFGKMTSQKEASIRQSAINQAKGKAHLTPMDGVATNDNSVEIPQNLRGMWEEAFPNKTWAERKALYNETLNQ